MLNFRINGKPHQYSGDPTMPLLWFLRDVKKLTGTKFGCGMGLCGACTVHLNGEAVRSCLLPVQAINGQEITTIEGLDKSANHPVQQAWEMLNVAQCGYCQCGQMMQAASLLATNASPSNKDIEQYMSGNICRCGTYPRIKNAIKLAAEITNKEK